MPAGISSLPPSSFDYDKKNLSPAFTIIPRDNFGTTLPILHLNNYTNDNDDENNHYNKSSNTVITNKITNNERNNLYSRRQISKSNDHLILASLQCNQTNPLKKNNRQSKSHELLNGNEKKSRKDLSLSSATALMSSTKSVMNISTENFNEILTSKLNKVQEQELNSNQNCHDDHYDEQLHKGGKLKQQIPLKKPFITTVKTGEFLMPPPEVAAILGMAPNGEWIGHDTATDSPIQNHSLPRSKFRPLVSLNRRPEVRHSIHNARCQAAAIKATVDFAVNIVNSSNATTASTFASAAQRLNCKNNNNNIKNQCIENGLLPSMTPRALPKKLQPIADTMPITMSYWDQSLPFGNMMYDRRVVRGSTFTSASALADEHQSQINRNAETKRRQLFKKRCQTHQSSRSMLLRLSSPPPVPGRKHEPVQTELYLEELCEKPEESEVATQTDYFMDRPSTPPFCPEKTGIDAETQIAPGDLFDYDTEVQPILDVLVGKTIEQALTEVLEEEEVAAIKEQQRRFLELRAAEKAEALRLEEQERRLREEKDRRVKQHEEALKTQQETEERVAAAVLLTGYIAELLPTVLDGLKVSGYLLDEMKSDTEDGFMPWLVKEVKREMNNMVDSRELLSDIIREILEKRAAIYEKQGEDYDASRVLSSTASHDDDVTVVNELEQSYDDSDENNTNYEQLSVTNNSNDV